MYRKKEMIRQFMISAISWGPWSISGEDKEHPVLIFDSSTKGQLTSLANLHSPNTVLWHLLSNLMLGQRFSLEDAAAGELD